MFNANKNKDRLIVWNRNWFGKNGPDSQAIIGISGGKDSTVAAALLVAALGKERVVGVMMPNGHQADLGDSRKVCELLDIQNYTCNIENIVREFKPFRPTPKTTKQAQENLPPRVRMTLLYYISQNLNGRVCNTCNLSEDYLGYSTRWGDECGDFAPLRGLTCTEVMKVGDALGLPYELVHKTPSDGLCGMTDEERFGFTYRELDMFLRMPYSEVQRVLSKETIAAIKKRHDSTEFKRQPMAQYTPFGAKPYRLGLVLGRFQPFHLGHAAMIQEAFLKCDKVLVMVGSAQESGTYNNPFSYDERRLMIRGTLDYIFGPASSVNIQIAPINDVGLGNNADWGDHVLRKVQTICGELPDAFFTGEEARRTSWFDGKDIDVITLDKSEISASKIRDRVYAGDLDSVLSYIPYDTMKFIKDSGLIGHPPAKKETKSI